MLERVEEVSLVPTEPGILTVYIYIYGRKSALGRGEHFIRILFCRPDRAWIVSNAKALGRRATKLSKDDHTISQVDDENTAHQHNANGEDGIECRPSHEQDTRKMRIGDHGRQSILPAGDPFSGSLAGVPSKVFPPLFSPSHLSSSSR